MQISDSFKATLFKVLRRLFYLFAIIVLMAIYGHAHAETTPPTGVASYNLTYTGGADTGCATQYITSATAVNAYNSWKATFPRTLCDGSGNMSTLSTSSLSGLTITYTTPQTSGTKTITVTGLSCPTTGGWTLTQTQTPTCFRLDCSSGQTRNASGVCVNNTCTAGTVNSSGFYDYGTNSEGVLSPWICSGGCGYSFDGVSPSKRYMVDGKWHYMAQGGYYGDGHTCSPDTQNAPVSTAGVPVSTCAAGQTSGTVNGEKVCVNVSTGKPENPNTPQDKVTQKNTVQNADGSTTTTETTDNPDGSKNTVVTVNRPDGTQSKTESYTPPATTKAPIVQPATTAGAADVQEGTKKGLEDFCTNNPQNTLCKNVDSGTATTAIGANLYSKDAQLPSIETSISNFTAKVQTAPFYQAATGFFNVTVPSGSCGGMNYTASTPWGSMVFDLDSVFCSTGAESTYTVLGFGLKLAASWAAFSIAFLF